MQHFAIQIQKSEIRDIFENVKFAIFPLLLSLSPISRLQNGKTCDAASSRESPKELSSRAKGEHGKNGDRQFQNLMARTEREPEPDSNECYYAPCNMFTPSQSLPALELLFWSENLPRKSTASRNFRSSSLKIALWSRESSLDSSWESR